MSMDDHVKSSVNNTPRSGNVNLGDNTFTADDSLQTPIMSDPQTEGSTIDQSKWKEFQPEIWRNEMNGRLGNVTATFRSELQKIKNQNRELLKSLNSSNDVDFLKGFPGAEISHTKFTESLNSYNDIFDKLIDASNSSDTEKFKKDLHHQLEAVIQTTTSTIEGSAKALNEQLKGSEDDLLDSALLETLHNHDMKQLVEHGNDLRDFFKSNTDDYIAPLQGFATKIAEVANKMPERAQDLRERMKKFENEFDSGIKDMKMDDKFKELDKEMKKVTAMVDKERKNLNDLGFQLQSTVDVVEKKYQEAITEESERFKEKMEAQYQKIREKMEEEMKAEMEKAQTGKNAMDMPISEMYEKKVDMLEKKVVKLNAECNFLRTRVEEIERSGPRNDNITNVGAYDKLLNRLKVLEDENNARKEKELKTRDHELDDVDLSEIVPDRLTSIRVITPLGKGILLQRRASDGFHEIELDNWKAILYIKTVAIDLP
eukprot:g1458.t1